MPQKINIKNDDGIIMVESSGRVSYGDFIETFNNVKKLVEKTGYNKLLDDATNEELILSTFEIFEFFSEYIPRNLKHAMLVDDRTKSKSSRMFGETVAKNRGFQVQLFENRTSAIDWLLA